MPTIRVSLSLPYALRLGEGNYQTALVGEVIQISTLELDEIRTETIVSAEFEHEAVADIEEQSKIRSQDADRLLRRTNRLLRWYRAVRQRADITELTRAQASPFRFELIGTGDLAGWTEPIVYEDLLSTPVPLTREALTARVREGLAGGDDPEVDVLFLLDAERAIHQGRFREAILFCWSTIDSVFNRKYDAVVDATLVDDWSSAREFLKDNRFGLRNKMSVMMWLVSGRSLFQEPDNFWGRMSASYAKRNAIIHRGENASEDEARAALLVARSIVAIMNEVIVPPIAIHP